MANIAAYFYLMYDFALTFADEVCLLDCSPFVPLTSHVKQIEYIWKRNFTFGAR